MDVSNQTITGLAPGTATTNPGIYVFIIVGPYDIPLYECDLTPPTRREDTPHLDQFVLHAALDVVDELTWQSPNLYLRQVDRFNDFAVFAYVTPGHVKFMLLHKPPSNPLSNTKGNDEGIRDFFTEIHQMYLKSLMNPFYEPNSTLSTLAFDNKVRAAAKKFLPI